VSYVTIGFKNFSTVNKTNWTVFKTYLNKQRYAYRKDYVCQHASKHKSLAVEQNPDKNRIRNKNCQASIKILIKNETPNTLRKEYEECISFTKIDYYYF